MRSNERSQRNAKNLVFYISLASMLKGFICHFSDRRITWLWVLIWDGSISENFCLIEVSKPAKFHAFIMK